MRRDRTLLIVVLALFGAAIILTVVTVLAFAGGTPIAESSAATDAAESAQGRGPTLLGWTIAAWAAALMGLVLTFTRKGATSRSRRNTAGDAAVGGIILATAVGADRDAHGSHDDQSAHGSHGWHGAHGSHDPGSGFGGGWGDWGGFGGGDGGGGGGDGG